MLEYISCILTVTFEIRRNGGLKLYSCSRSTYVLEWCQEESAAGGIHHYRLAMIMIIKLITISSSTRSKTTPGNAQNEYNCKCRIWEKMENMELNLILTSEINCKTKTRQKKRESSRNRRKRRETSDAEAEGLFQRFEKVQIELSDETKTGCDEREGTNGFTITSSNVREVSLLEQNTFGKQSEYQKGAPE